MPVTKPTIHERRIQIEQQAQRFVQEHLTEDYGRLVTHMLDVLEQKHPRLLQQGDVKIYAGGVVHALAANNFLFSKAEELHTTPAEIADFLGIKQSGMTQRSAQLSRTLGISQMDLTWLSDTNRERVQDLHAMIAERLSDMIPGATPQDILAEMPFFGHPESTPDEFVDKERASEVGFYEFMDRASYTPLTPEEAEKAMAQMIGKDPNFLDPYATAAQIHEEMGHPDIAEALLEDAYERAVELISDENGKWPARISWGFLENRHILRALASRVVTWYEQGKSDLALELARKLLRMSPDDNMGIRYYIVAIRENMTAKQFNKRFDRGGFWDHEIGQWFESKFEKYPEEFEDVMRMMEG